MGTITILGTGWTAGELTLDAVEALEGARRILLHTERCGCAEWLRRRGISYESLDGLYDACEDFDEHARMAADAVLRAAEDGDVVYAVADVRDRSATLLASREGAAVSVIAGPPVEGALLALGQGQFRSVEASDWEDFSLTPRENCLVRELESRELAACVKLKLMEVYPEEERIWLLSGEAAPISMPLYELDRAEGYDHRTCALIPAQRDITALERYDFEHLNEIMRLLCSPGGCPWDRVQTHESLRTCILEEAYEVMDAIDEGDPEHLYDELGDMLMQVAIHAEIARRHGEFDVGDVTTAICRKMIRRHSHIFGADSAGDAEQVLELWSRNKMAERGQTTLTEVLSSVTRTLPALLRAVKVLKRSAEVGLGDSDVDAVIHRAARRLEALTVSDDAEAAIGELLMDVAGLARLMKADPEIALDGAIKRFIGRFGGAEEKLLKSGLSIDHMDRESLRKHWDSVKL